IVRSRLEGLGPVTADALAAPLRLSRQRIEQTLHRLQSEGFVVTGRFAADAPQWCERRLLARIHRYTLQRLRREVEPVSPARFQHFLLDWHGLTEPPEGVEALAGAIEKLEGFSLAAAAWESDVLPGRVADYAPHLLDQLLSTGRFTWLRLVPPAPGGERRRRPGPLRQTPIALVERASMPLWRSFVPVTAEPGALSPAGARVLAALQEKGAQFFVDLVSATGMLRTQVEEALSELVAWGLASADTFNGIRALIAPAHKRPSLARRGRRRGRHAPAVDTAGRWTSLVQASTHREVKDARGATAMTDMASLESVAWTLLGRYGVVFRRLLDRETALPPWRELLYVLRRLEARGEIRGGRFVDGFSGEQFALPDAVGALKRRREGGAGESLVAVSAADPLNLAGILLPGPRIPASPGNRILFRGGRPVAELIAGEVRYHDELPAESQWRFRQKLLRRGSGPDNAARGF
ncbi:MAG: ATP-dependent DNA helicase, partial [Ectothiorhodospiraceae bacterium]